MPAQKKTYKDYESAVERLEELTEKLESGEVRLEEAIALYTEGLEIATFCDKQLNDAEKKIKIITEKNNQLSEEFFDEELDEDE